MFYERARQLFKHTLSLAGIKLLYARITLTRVTAFYFVLSFASCAGLVAMQGLTFTDNTQAVELLGTVFAQSQKVTGLPIVTDGVLRICQDIPERSTNCTAMAFFNGIEPLTEGNGAISVQKRGLDGPAFLFARHGVEEEGLGEEDVMMGLSLGLSDSCVASLKWLNDVLHDAQREDVVTLFFHIWLFILAIITIVNESIPHLGAGFLGHVLGTAWASYRLQSTFEMRDFYRSQIVPSACGGIDLMANWWEIRISHATPILVFNVLALLSTGFVSYKLFQVYANQSFCRVGASERVYRIYKIVMLFSVCMQLSGFFSIASTAMWIDKVCHGLIHSLAKHSDFYLAAFIVTLVFHVPWLYFGWICVRKECRIRFGVFCGISVLLITISTLVFFSHLYRYIFSTWPFFATVTVTAYCLVIGSTVLGVVCQFNFGQGLAHYLLVTEALEGVDFTPVNFSTKGSSDLEKNEKKHTKNLSDESFDSMPNFTVAAWPPAATPGSRNDIPNANANIDGTGNGIPTRTGRKKHRGASIYSEKGGEPIVLTFSPPLVSELGPAPNRLSKASSISRYSVYNKASRARMRESGRTFGPRDTIIEDAETPARGAGEGDGDGPAHPPGMGMVPITRPPPIAAVTVAPINTNVRNSRLNPRTTTSPIFDTPASVASSVTVVNSPMMRMDGNGKTQMQRQMMQRDSQLQTQARMSNQPQQTQRSSGSPSNPRMGSPPSGGRVLTGLPASPKARQLGGQE